MEMASNEAMVVSRSSSSSGVGCKRKRNIDLVEDIDYAHQACFGKRRHGLFTTESEITILCGSRTGIPVFVGCPPGRPCREIRSVQDGCLWWFCTKHGCQFLGSSSNMGTSSKLEGHASVIEERNYVAGSDQRREFGGVPQLEVTNREVQEEDNVPDEIDLELQLGSLCLDFTEEIDLELML